jgi:hypothetical protein
MRMPPAPWISGSTITAATVVVLGQGLFHGGEHVARVFFPAHALGAQVAIRAGHLDGVQQQRLVGFGEQRHVAHRHRGHGFAVVAVGQGDEALLPGLPRFCQ